MKYVLPSALVIFVGLERVSAESAGRGVGEGVTVGRGVLVGVVLEDTKLLVECWRACQTASPTTATTATNPIIGSSANPDWLDRALSFLHTMFMFPLMLINILDALARCTIVL